MSNESDWPAGTWGPGLLENDLTQTWLDELEEAGAPTLRRVLTTAADGDFHAVGLRDQVHAVAASLVAVSVFDPRFNGALGARAEGLRHVVTAQFEWDRSTAVEALRRVLADGSPLRSAWTGCRGEGEWLAGVEALRNTLREAKEQRKYSPKEHRKEIARISDAAPARQLMFALWCLEPLWMQARSSFEGQLPTDQFRAVLQVYDALWTQESTEKLSTLSTDDFDVAMEMVEFEDCPFGATTVASALKSLAKGQWLHGATSAAMAMIDLVIRYVDEVAVVTTMTSEMRRAVDDAPAVFAELALQRVMLDSACEGRPVIDAREQRRRLWSFLPQE